MSQLLSFVAVIIFVMISSPFPLFAQQSAGTDTFQSMTKIKYEPIKYFVSGKRIRITADVTDPEGIKLVRCYFKGKEQADFVFVNMTPGSSTYTAILPAAAQNASSIDYLFLAVNNKNQVIKTQQFSVNIDASQPAPPWQDVAMEGQLTVSTELAQAPAVLKGFADSIAIDLVESSVSFGFVAGIYTSTEMAAAGGTTGAAATATSAGTVSTTATAASAGTAAAAGGMSIGTITAIAGGVAAVGVAGTVAASSGGGGGSGSSSTSATYNATGTWNWFDTSGTDLCDPPFLLGSGTVTITQTGNTWTAISSDTNIPGSGTVSGATYTSPPVSILENGGTTTANTTFTLSSSTAGTFIHTWTWTDGITSCSGGENGTMSKVS